MSTTARDKAWEDYAGTAPSISPDTRHAFEAGWDAGRASVLAALTEERIADEVVHRPIGSAFYETFIDMDEAREIARAVLALIEQETTK